MDVLFGQGSVSVGERDAEVVEETAEIFAVNLKLFEPIEFV